MVCSKLQHNFLLEMAKGTQSLFNEFEAGTTFDKNDPIVVTNKLVVRDEINVYQF